MASPGTARIFVKGFVPPPEGKATRVESNGRSVAVFSVRGALFAIDADCTHVGAPLEEGQVEERRVECPWHGSVFDLETGQVLRGPAELPVTAYRAFMEKDGLVLEPRPSGTGVPEGH
jgi:nitrite reductase/ring-hydroxylating ferredoxin subunit